MNRLFTIAEVAERFGLSPAQVIRKCSTSVAPWPHLRPVARKSSTWCFSEEDIEAIETRIRTRELSSDAWGRTGRRRSA